MRPITSLISFGNRVDGDLRREDEQLVAVATRSSVAGVTYNQPLLSPRSNVKMEISPSHVGQPLSHGAEQ